MMKNLLDIIHLLKRFGIFVYTGDRGQDLGLMQSEVRDLYHHGLLSKDDYLQAILVLRQEQSKIE
jgi:uncharacterized protein YqgQ